VVLAVSDTGCGIEPAIQARVFEPFFTTKDVGKGTGLGLATVFGIVKQSGGAIAVYSEPGKGSTFRVYVPRHDRAGAQAERPAPTSPIRAVRSERVLLVEDDDQLRAVIARQLVSWGYRVYAADCGTSALAMLERMLEPIDLVLTDLVMPGLDGRAFASRVLVARPHTKVLFMSGYSEHAAVTTAALGDGDHFLAKPFTASALSSAIQRALGSRVTTAARAE